MKRITLHKFLENSRRRYIIIGASILFVVVSYGMLSDQGFIKRFTLGMDQNNLNEQITAERHTSDSLRQIIKKLYSDSTEIERIAREKYGMVRNGEEVFFITKKKTEE